MIPKVDLDIKNKTKKSRVVVAMSGGVDSSVAAALVKASGYEAIGITLQLYDDSNSPKKKGSCCAGQDIHDAKKVASTLKIPHYVLDYEKIFGIFSSFCILHTSWSKRRRNTRTY